MYREAITVSTEVRRTGSGREFEFYLEICGPVVSGRILGYIVVVITAHIIIADITA